METAITKKMLFDHFGNHTSPIQRKAIEQWLQHRENEELYYQWLEEWERIHLQYTPETEVLLQQFFAATADDTEQVAAREQLPELPGWWRRNWLQVAAVLLLGICAGGVFRDEIRFETYRTGYGQIATHKLPDGSVVKLNANTTLRIPRWDFGRNAREVYLSGEAGFHIRHLPDHQKFIVKTSENFEVVVLGTEFTMTARKYYSKVVLTNGKVSLRYRDASEQKELVMMPGDLVKLSPNTLPVLRKTDEPEQYAQWEDKRFVFEETTLEEVGFLLHENYGLQVDFREQDLARRTLMGSFKGKTIDELLISIADVLDISVSRKGNEVYFMNK